MRIFPVAAAASGEPDAVVEGTVSMGMVVGATVASSPWRRVRARFGRRGGGADGRTAERHHHRYNKQDRVSAHDGPLPMVRR